MNNRIKLLSPDIYNKIAAGEVIENPVGVVKELVENCVDAGSHRIVIEAKNGGFDLISVTDNGCGIKADDVEFAFLKHATSKVGTIDDIYYLQTLGFRGEALASIASVSKVKLTTRSIDTEMATCVVVENGEIISKNFVSANVGTKIEVRDLFYNTPARKKFLKTPSREGGEITKFVAKFILTNPHIEIVYYLDDQLVYQNKGNNLEEAIFAIYGDDCLDSCLKVSYSWQLTNITGYIGKPDFAKPNKNWQTLAVNGRCITDTKISASIMQAYKPYLMTRQYPFYVLFLEIPCDKTDVNVHPKKSEIRFTQHDKVAGAFYNAVSNALTKYIEECRNNPFEYHVVDESQYIDPNSTYESKPYFGDILEKVNVQPMNEHQAQDVLDIERATENAEDQVLVDQKTYRLSQELNVEQMRKLYGFPEPDYNGKPKKKKQQEAELPPDPGIIVEVDEDEEMYARTRILGVAFRTYIILEYEDKIIFVDQHAAHERILYDQFMLHRDQKLQPLMFPYAFHVTPDEAAFIEDNIENIKKAGIEVHPFGKENYRITAVANDLLEINLYNFVQFLLSSVDELRLDSDELIQQKIAQRACKAAIKAGYVPNKYEIIYILKRVADGSVLTCPHGRPITSTITKAQLEKMFKRKV